MKFKNNSLPSSLIFSFISSSNKHIENLIISLPNFFIKVGELGI
jgi:hypothetical protein